MMSETRERILQRLSDSPPGSTKPYSPQAQSASILRSELIERFRSRLEAVRGQVQQVSADDWLPNLGRILSEKGVKRLLIGPEIWPGRELRQQPPSGIELVFYDQPVEAWKPALFHEIDAALTGAAGAIAETGSLVLCPSIAEPRLMSLVPPLHLVVLHADSIHSTFADLLLTQNWAERMPANLLLISGPSKSADIEQVLAYGVHGPEELIVLLLE